MAVPKWVTLGEGLYGVGASGGEAPLGFTVASFEICCNVSQPHSHSHPGMLCSRPASHRPARGHSYLPDTSGVFSLHSGAGNKL